MLVESHEIVVAFHVAAAAKEEDVVVVVLLELRCAGAAPRVRQLRPVRGGVRPAQDVALAYAAPRAGPRQRTCEDRGDTAPASSSASSSSSASTKVKFPDGTSWMTPYFRALTHTTNVEGHQERHSAIPNTLVAALRAVVESRDKTISKMREELDEINQANRNGSSYRGLQRNGSNGWAVLVAKEQSGNKGREYIGTYLDENLAAIKWDQGMLRLNGLSMIWKLNKPNEENTIKMIKELQRQSIGQPMSWGGKQFEGGYTCTQYFGVYSPVPGWKPGKGVSTSAPSKGAAPAVNAAKRAVSAGVVSADSWVPGLPAPFVAIARCAGKTAIIGRYPTAEEAACAYDEVASIIGLPTNGVTYEEVRSMRDQVQENAVAVFANEVKARGLKLSKRGRRPKDDSNTDADGKKVAFAKITRDEVRALKADRKKMEKMEKQLEKHKQRQAKMKAKEDERKAKKAAKKDVTGVTAIGKKRKGAPGKKVGAKKKQAFQPNLHEV
jgi:hypothetical protein